MDNNSLIVYECSIWIVLMNAAFPLSYYFKSTFLSSFVKGRTIGPKLYHNVFLWNDIDNFNKDKCSV